MRIDTVIARMTAQLDELRHAGDGRTAFQATYLRTTRAVADALRAGAFLDAGWVERWDAAFAGLYLDALDAARRGDPVPRPWAVAFEAATGERSLPALQHVLLGMNAHINYDLPQALLAVISDDEFDDPAVLARRAAEPAAVVRPRAGRAAGMRAVDGVLPAPVAAVPRVVRRAGAGRVSAELDTDPARSLAGAAGQPAMGAGAGQE